MQDYTEGRYTEYLSELCTLTQQRLDQYQDTGDRELDRCERNELRRRLRDHQTDLNRYES